MKLVSSECAVIPLAHVDGCCEIESFAYCSISDTFVTDRAATDDDGAAAGRVFCLLCCTEPNRAVRRDSSNSASDTPFTTGTDGADLDDTPLELELYAFTKSSTSSSSTTFVLVGAVAAVRFD